MKKTLILASLIATVFSSSTVFAAKRPDVASLAAMEALQTIAPDRFDFAYTGELTGALQKLKEIQPGLALGKHQGKAVPITVDLTLNNASLYETLKVIAEQAGDIADVVWDGRIAFLRYKASAPKGMDAVRVQAKKWQMGENAQPVLSPEGVLLFPFGQGQPEIVCAPLRACSIQLQKGEVINNVILGDTVRWIPAPAKTGEGPMATPHVIVKPTEKGLTTNLLVTTNRRTYVMTLRSSDTNYSSVVGYYYPYDMVQNWQGEMELAQRKADEESNRKVADMPITSIEQLNLDGYEILGNNRLPWFPTRVFDDGTHVWIQMPATMRSSEAPALVVLDSRGNSQLVNYRVKSAKQGGQDVTYYIVDKLFERAGLIIGVDRDQQKVEIVKKHGQNHTN
ncbi:MAG: P-type conjugative transfer protein TrbG [Methylotenera sp.]|nr:MAG: P-type conjugative transfer protein TrbG [Methylotenera sp.]